MTGRGADGAPAVPAFLTGEMAELMRSWPWADTALGPPEGWPEMLRSSLSICLGARFPIAIYWGPSLALVYNDAWRPILGGKHPRALGRPAVDVWPEIWDAIGPLFERVVATGAGTYSEDQLLPMHRHGFTEECYFNFTFSPILGGDGRVGGVFNAVLETTERVVGERRLRTLRGLGERSAIGATVEGACGAAAAALGENPADLPFALLYVAGDGGGPLALAASAGAAAGAAFAPAVLGPSTALGAALGAATASGDPGDLDDLVVIDAPEVRFGALPGGAWPESPRQIVALPLARAGGARSYGLLVAGANPRRPLDEGYRGFLRLAAGHVASAIAGARAFEEERRRAEALAELDRAKTAFFGNVSHEFRTPLTLMLAPIEELRAAAAGGEERERVELLSRNARRLLRLVNDLLDFARLEAGRLDASYEPTDLAALTADLASTFRSTIERAGLAFDVACEPGPEPAYVDRVMWEKVVLNLLSNAFKFTLAGSIAVRLRWADDGAHLEVADTGSGIAAGELPRLFDRFHRVAGARGRSHEGSGIGLALVHELVRLHGGEVRVESREGEGTTFRVRVPRGAAHLPPGAVRAAAARPGPEAAARAFVDEASRWDAPAESAPPPSAPRGAGGPRARIVVADDNADMRDYVGRLLGERWEVEAYRDGRAALEAVRRRPPDLVLTDVMMPGLDGFGLLRAIRGDAHLRGTPVVLVSARAGEEAVAEALSAGADDYLVKPFSARELLVRVAARLATAGAARALQEQRSDLYRAFMQAPFPVAIFRGPGHVIEAANDAMLRAWRKGPEVVGLPVIDALPEIRDQAFPRLLDEAFRSGVAYQGREERALLARDPSGPRDEAYFNFVFAPFRDAAGEVAGLFVTAFEVTEQVKSRAALEVTSRRLEAAQSVGGVGMFDWDVATDVVYWSPELYKLLGLAPGSVAPSPEEWTARLYGPDREAGWGAFGEAVAARRRRFDLELRLVQPDGTTRWIRLSSSVEYDGAGAPARALGAVVDIEELKRAATAREAERRRLFTMLQHVPAVVNFLRGPDFVFEFAHPQAVEAAGGRQLLGRPVFEAFPEYRGRPEAERLRRTFERGEPDVSHETEVRVVQGGREVASYWDSVYVPLRDESGRVEGVMTFDLDVTRGVLARRELEAASRAKDEFLATVSHELRTPLNAVLGWAALLQRDPTADGAKLARGLAAIERNAHAQARLVSDLLDVSRIVSGKLRLAPRAIEPAAAVRAAVDVVRPAADAKGVRLDVDLDPGLGALVADPDRLQQIVWNLLANAVRFTPPGGRVAVKAGRAGGEFRLEVNDTGAGIPPEHLPHVFERFRQVDSSTTRAHGGLGLGLAIVRHLTEAHGGTVGAASDGPGKGAAFTVRLPIPPIEPPRAPSATGRAGDAPPPGRAPDGRDPPATPAVLEGVRALVVDDDADSLELLRVVLEDAGAVVTAANGARAALAAGGPFDVIVSDIGMPQVDGYALMERIRAGGPAAGVPAIALTAYARREDVERALRAGFQEHVIKPVDAAKLVEIVRAWARRP